MRTNSAPSGNTGHLTPETLPIMLIGSQKWLDIIVEGARAFDIEVSQRQAGQFAAHAAELLRWNRKINLTAITDPFEVAVKHFLDSVPAARHIPVGATLLDIGSGGGFPGLALKILMPSLSATLIDSSRKKVSFLKHVIRTLELENIEALHIRAEDLAQDPQYRNRFKVVISRALSSLGLFHRLASPFLIEGGCIIALKGDRGIEETDELQAMRTGEGGDPPTAERPIAVTVQKYQLPFSKSRRSIVIINS